MIATMVYDEEKAVAVHLSLADRLQSLGYKTKKAASTARLRPCRSHDTNH